MLYVTASHSLNDKSFVKVGRVRCQHTAVQIDVEIPPSLPFMSALFSLGMLESTTWGFIQGVRNVEEQDVQQKMFFRRRK